ncbi:CDP-diglyceride synthetase [Bifidobacterium italicum]|uniref:Phosphatidate cytidylyltransferase n=2 Tax=Bifidobacterium italicum TaxID=1960968 RepID=A0A2A2EIG0_9BIFI|nr:CDP-diglyceride synthetase [Bifidobacterium italicum]
MPHTQQSREAEERLQQINRRTGRNMPQAVATAVVLIVIILACLFISPTLFAMLVVVFMIPALWELRVDLATRGLRIPVLTLWICSTATLLAVYFCERHVVAMAVGVLASLLVVAVTASLQITLNGRTSQAVADKATTAPDVQARLRDDEPHGRLTQVAVAMFTVLYIPLLASCIIMPITFNGHPVAHAILIVFMPALSDTGGLFAGAWLGRHKLCPTISPKKSVEGLLGSILFAMAGCFAVFACTYEASLWASRWRVPIVAGVMIGVVGTFGDLCASLIKRDLGIKDMGHLLKGHGGILDRVDSILLCAPFICVLLWMTGL